MNNELAKNKVAKSGAESALKTKGKKRNVYFMYDSLDKAEVVPIKKDLIKAGLNVIEPDFASDPVEMRNFHLEQLKQFDLGIIFQGKVSPNWVKMKVLDMLKAPGLGRQKPILGKAIISGADVKINKEFFQDFDVELLSVDNDKSITKQLDDFLESLSVAI